MRNTSSAIYNLCLMIGDCLALLVAFSVAYILRVTVSHRALSAHVQAHTYFMISITLLPFWVLIFALLGLYNARHYENRFSELGRLIVASFIGILFAISYAYIANVEIFPARLVTLYDFGLAFFIVFVFRTVARGIRRELFSYGIGINYVLIVGDTRTTRVLLESLASTSETGYKVVGIVGGIKHPLKSSGTQRTYTDFSEAVAHLGNLQLHTIFQTELYANNEKNDEILTYSQEHHIAYRFVPGNSELFTGNIEVDLFHSIPVIAVNQTALVGWGRIVKRISDLTLGTLALIIASPFMLIIAIAVKLSDGGPIFFRQERMSRFETTVRIFKFRSLKIAYNGLSPEEAFVKIGKPELITEYRAHADSLRSDPRVSPLGRFLRNSKLDELPQLFNVVHGDISLVGPRAIVREELSLFSQKSLILSVKSGLTGLAQISGRANISFDERRKIDLYYVQNWSFSGDLIILIKTIWIVLRRKGTR
jgi:exopolysaccharide biosynthesis polyprenyl glycosylphosphotransferase